MVMMMLLLLLRLLSGLLVLRPVLRRAGLLEVTWSWLPPREVNLYQDGSSIAFP